MSARRMIIASLASVGLLTTLTVASLLFALVWSIVPNAGATVEVFGTVVCTAGYDTDQVDSYLFVGPDQPAGIVVPVLMHSPSGIQRGGRVRLLAQLPLTFGETTYRFRNYVTRNGPGESAQVAAVPACP